jgi:hypothetical protein
MPVNSIHGHREVSHDRAPPDGLFVGRGTVTEKFGLSHFGFS